MRTRVGEPREHACSTLDSTEIVHCSGGGLIPPWCQMVWSQHLPVASIGFDVTVISCACVACSPSTVVDCSLVTLSGSILPHTTFPLYRASNLVRVFLYSIPLKCIPRYAPTDLRPFCAAPTDLIHAIGHSAFPAGFLLISSIFLRGTSLLLSDMQYNCILCPYADGCHLPNRTRAKGVMISTSWMGTMGTRVAGLLLLRISLLEDF